MSWKIPGYRNPGVGYRRPGIVYRRDYEDTTKSTVLTQPARRAVTVRVYDLDDLMVAQIGSNSQQCTLLGADWQLLETGCGSFELETSVPLNVGADYRVDIHLWNNPTAIYSGLIQDIPDVPSTEQTYKYEGYGLFDYFNRMVIDTTYTAQNLRGIVIDLANLAASRYRRFTVDQGQVASVSYNLTGTLDFLNVPLKDAMKQASDLSGDYVWGIDAQRRFFFQPRSSVVDQNLWVGKHLETFVPRASTVDLQNVLYVKCGAVRKDLPTTDRLYKTNWLDAPVKNLDSIALYGIREGVYNAPGVLGLIDAQQSAQVELSRRSQPRRYASIGGLIYNGQDLSCTGSARVVGKGGEITLPKKSLKFSLKDTFVDVSLELGDLDYGAELLIARLQATAAAETLARQQSQKQL